MLFGVLWIIVYGRPKKLDVPFALNLLLMISSGVLLSVAFLSLWVIPFVLFFDTFAAIKALLTFVVCGGVGSALLFIVKQRTQRIKRT